MYVILLVMLLAGQNVYGKDSSTQAFNNTLSYVKKTNSKSKSWHKELIKGPNERLRELHSSFLTPFILGCQTISKDEEIAQLLMSLIFIQKLTPNIFKKYELHSILEGCFEQIEQLSIPQKIHLFELQPYCDFWYFTKRFKHKEFKIETTILSQHINSPVLKKVTNSFEALVFWNYLEALKYCNPSFYKSLKSHKKHLETVIKKDEFMHGYLLSLDFLYETEFGHKKLSHQGKKIFKLLNKYCSEMNFKKAPLDLIAQLFICYKIYNQTDSKIGKLIAQHLTKVYPQNFQEACLLFAAAA